jgi:SAM-dependent methyltransferase
VTTNPFAVSLADLSVDADEKCGPWHLTRYFMYSALSDLLGKSDKRTARCLSISNSNGLCRVLGLRHAELVIANYPEHNMMALGFDDGSFDFCVSDQVLEHVEGDPFNAIKESLRVLKPGGVMVHTTCLINPIHRAPGDFWRFTPAALQLLCVSAGAVVQSAGSWGNRAAIALCEMGQRMTKVPLRPTHPLHVVATRNERDWPIVTWVVAKKPEAAR